MIDRYTKIVLTIIAVNLTLIVADAVLSRAIPDAWAQQQSVWVDGGNLRVTSVGYVGGGTLDVNVTGGFLDVNVTGGRLDADYRDFVR